MLTTLHLRHALLIPLCALLVSACDTGNNAASATPLPIVAATIALTDTPLPPADTAVPPRATTVPPTATALMPTGTPVPLTDTVAAPTDSALPATDTPLPLTATPLPPTQTQIPVNTPLPPTHTSLPATVTRLPSPTAAIAPTHAPLLPTATAGLPTATPPPIATLPPTAPPTIPLATPAPIPPAAPPAGASALPTQPPGTHYDAYIPAALKQHQVAHFTCEFDAAWVVLATDGIQTTTEDLIPLVGIDTSVEPTWEETKQGVIIHGGDVTQYYSGDYATNFLARSTGQAVRKIFDHYGLRVTPVHTQAGIEAALRRGELVWIKTTADFLAGRPALWIMPNGRSYHTVLGNDHAAVVIGYNSQVAVIRDVLGPTSTNANRAYEYEVPWPRFLQMWASQENDGLAVAPAK